jgi:hypothetical protein
MLPDVIAKFNLRRNFTAFLSLIIKLLFLPTPGQLSLRKVVVHLFMRCRSLTILFRETHLEISYKVCDNGGIVPCMLIVIIICCFCVTFRVSSNDRTLL